MDKYSIKLSDIRCMTEHDRAHFTAKDIALTRAVTIAKNGRDRQTNVPNQHADLKSRAQRLEAVSFPEPYPGLVLRYVYPWRRQFDAGHAEGTKDRPCAVIMTVVDEEGEGKSGCYQSHTARRPTQPMQSRFHPRPRAGSRSTSNAPGS